MPTIADAMDDVLREHLPNEVKRLNDAFKRLLVHDLDRAMVDILIESFCIHAHNLIEFFLEETLTPKGRNAVAGARHYVGRSYTAFEGNNIRAEESYEKLKAQVDHIRYGREKGASQLQGPELTYLKRTLDAEIKRPTCHLNMVRPGKGRWLASTCTPDENLHQNLFEAGTVESRLRLPKCSFAPRRAFS